LDDTHDSSHSDDCCIHMIQNEAHGIEIKMTRAN